MKRLMTILLVIPVIGFSQNLGRNYYQLQGSYWELTLRRLPTVYPYGVDDKAIQKENVKTVTATFDGKRRNSPPINQTWQYTENGLLTRWVHENGNINYFYEDTLLTRTEWVNKKGSGKTERTYKNGLLSFESNYRNNQLTNTFSFEFNDYKRLTQHDFVNYKRKKANRYSMNYEYNDQQKLAKTIYKANGKIVNTWNYDCSEKGVQLTKEQTKTEVLSSVCTFEEAFADGRYVVYNRKLKRGKEYLTKNTFSKDSVLMLSEEFKNDSILYFRTTYDPNKTTIESFNKRGKIISGYISEFSENNQTRTNLGKGGKITSSSITRSNANKQLLSMTYFKKNRKILSQFTYQYDDNDLVTKYTHSYKGKHLSVRNYTYTFY